jgi:hypothetical protein
MRGSRRELLIAGAATALLASAAAVAKPPRRQRLLCDAPSDDLTAIVLAPGVFIDDALVAALPPGAYRARLNPANLLLLREVLRSRRVRVADTDPEAGLHFTVTRRAG